ncbi:hypothetical protein B0J17DRAFT_382854 [Rhizoctonia solani]|nr:hypothetical protein B0J17DRAFT_382854 [Rhizoctonia solani]
MPCVISTANITLQSVFPTFSLDNRGKKCMDDTWQSINIPDLGPDIHVYNTHSNNRYFKHRNFITSNNLYNSAVLEIFNQTTLLIQQCVDSEQHPLEAGGDNVEFVIIIRCISPNDPKVSYYIADHGSQKVKWLHDDVPRCYNMDTGVGMRDCAEYWHHRSKFPVHRHCIPADRDEVARLLTGILSSGDPNVDRVEIEGYVRKLGSVPLASALTDHQTSILARR